MTKAITLESKVEQFRDALYDGWNFGDYRYGISDVTVMVQLGCTPQSWSRYRPQIIQHCQYNDLVKSETIEGVEMDTINITMRYDKRNKQWYGKKNPLLIKKEKGLWVEMTLEEQEKYHIIWSPEDFLYTPHN